MGGNISSNKQDQFENERKKELSTITKKFKRVDQRSVLLVGPPQSGKTQLFNAVIGKEYSDQYEITDSAQMGFKIYSTNESRYEHLNPMSVHCVDAPGSFMRTEVASDFYFEKCDVVLIVVDISLVLDDSKIDKASQFVLRQVSMHHEYTRNANSIPPMICHVFTKQDRVQPSVKKRNDKVIRNLAKNGIIGNYLYVSAKTGLGLQELKKAIIDADIKNHGDKIRPAVEKKKTEPKLPFGEDPYDLLADEDMPQAIPGLLPDMMQHAETEKQKKRRKSKRKSNADDIVMGGGDSPDGNWRKEMGGNMQIAVGDFSFPTPDKNAEQNIPFQGR